METMPRIDSTTRISCAEHGTWVPAHYTGSFIGGSTRSEIAYAQKIGRYICWHCAYRAWIDAAHADALAEAQERAYATYAGNVA